MRLPPLPCYPGMILTWLHSDGRHPGGRGPSRARLLPLDPAVSGLRTPGRVRLPPLLLPGPHQLVTARQDDFQPVDEVAIWNFWGLWPKTDRSVRVIQASRILQRKISQKCDLVARWLQVIASFENNKFHNSEIHCDKAVGAQVRHCAGEFTNNEHEGSLGLHQNNL